MRIALFVDGSHLYRTAKHLGWAIDHRRILTQFATPEQLYNAFFYVPITDPEDERQQRFIDALVYMGYTVRSRLVRGEARFEAMMATDLLATHPRWDRAVVASTSADLAYTFGVLRALGKEIHLLGTKDLVDLELRNQADRFVELEEWREVLERTLGGRRTFMGYPMEATAEIPPEEAR